jgi:RimJ/RimL family protein N-acetyltransferase
MAWKKGNHALAPRIRANHIGVRISQIVGEVRMECATACGDAAVMKAGARTTDRGASSQHTRRDELDRGWPRHCKTRDGVEYRIRPIQADDVERDRAFLAGLSDSSRHNRLMGLAREPSPQLLEHLVHVDYQHDMAFVAVVGAEEAETIIGVTRYGGSTDTCEFAIAVADEWQSRGVGATLAELLFTYAKAHGVRRLYAVIFANNVLMLKLADYMQMTLRRSSNDDAILEAWRTL